MLRGLPGVLFILSCLENRGSMRPSIGSYNWREKAKLHNTGIMDDTSTKHIVFQMADPAGRSENRVAEISRAKCICSQIHPVQPCHCHCDLTGELRYPRLLLRRKHATGNEPISVADRSSAHAQRARFCLARDRSRVGDAPVPPLGGARPGQ